MSTFSGLNAASSALSAARLGMNIAGQNIANQDTEGYTRQRVETSAAAPLRASGLFAADKRAGEGVNIDKISRLGDNVLDARVRDTLSASGFWSTKATASLNAEAVLKEPTSDGLAAQLDRFWTGWQDLANNPDSAAAGAVVLADAKALVGNIADSYNAIAVQWKDARDTVDSVVWKVNAAADKVAALNNSIRDALNAGRSANELIDERNLAAQQISRLAGAVGTVEADGTMTLRIDGNAIVSGIDSRHLVVTGPGDIEAGLPTTVSWSNGMAANVTSGELGGILDVISPTGVLAGIANSYNDVATALTTAVNGFHNGGTSSTGAVTGDFFGVAAGPAALALSVLPEDIAGLATGAGGGVFDGSNADRIAQEGAKLGGPSDLWTKAVAKLASTTAAELSRASQAETSAVAAVNVQQSIAGVDGDEETVSLLKHQTAYNAAARVLTAIDEALDVLINKTGLVGR